MKIAVSIMMITTLTCFAGCASSYPTYPVLPQVLDADTSLSCEALDYELDQADQLRDQIIKEHGDVITDAVTDTAIDAVSNPVNAVLSGVISSVGVSGATKHYTTAIAAAGNRMEQLLWYKREKDCDTGITKEWGTSDEEMLTRLEELLVEYEAGNMSTKAYLKQRSEILTAVRY